MEITDSYTMNIEVIQHGFATIILPVTFPESVEMDTPFNITYTVKNTGAANDTLFGHLKVGNDVVPDSYWSENVAPDGTVTKTFTHPGINISTTFVLEVGRI